MKQITKETKYTVELKEAEYLVLTKLVQLLQDNNTPFEIHANDAWGVIACLMGGYSANVLKYLITEVE